MRSRTAADQNLHWKTGDCFPSGSSCPETDPAPTGDDGVRLWEDLGGVDMFDTFYNHWYNTPRQCHSSHAGIGCRREAFYIGGCTTGATSANYCHMCYDFHCTGCTNHHYESCTTGCQGQATHINTQKCDCDANFEGIDYTREDTTSPCCARHCAHCTAEEIGANCLECCPGDTTGVSGNEGECIEVTRIQPGFTIASDGFVVCSPTCPAGYELSGNL